MPYHRTRTLPYLHAGLFVRSYQVPTPVLYDNGGTVHVQGASCARTYSPGGVDHIKYLSPETGCHVVIKVMKNGKEITVSRYRLYT